jgi:hypothetical protein
VQSVGSALFMMPNCPRGRDCESGAAKYRGVA